MTEYGAQAGVLKWFLLGLALWFLLGLALMVAV